MRVKDYKCKCGHNDFFFADKGNQIGIYCSYCGKWLKWADKDEQNLRMKQEPILDDIRADIIEKAKSTMNDTRAEGLYMALQIIDKYKKEHEK